MKVIYATLAALTLIIGARFAGQFISAFQETKAADIQAATDARQRLRQHGTSPHSATEQATSASPDTPQTAPETSATPAPQPETHPQLIPPAPGESPAQVKPVRHPGPLHNTHIFPANFEYLGAFRPPHVEDLTSSFSYSGGVVAFSADGDTNGTPDGFPGSLFLSGHLQQQQVAEISIPQPVISPRQSLDDLPIAEVLQPFGDISGGIQQAMTGDPSQPFQLGGLQVTGRALHWTIFRYYNVEGFDFLSHGLSSLSVQRPYPAGPWHLGPFESGSPEWHAYKHAGYICSVPDNMAAALGGRNLLSGLQISTGLQTSSQGPALFAYRLPDGTPEIGTQLDAVPLLWYAMDRPLPGHHPADSWTGAAWLQSGEKQVLAVFGRKATGPLYYGEARPGDCSPNKGYHGPPYEAQVLFYAVEDLLQAATGARQAFDIQPVYRWTSDSPGGSLSSYMFPTCSQELGGLALDREHNRLYLVQRDAGVTSDNQFEPLPIVHVFRIRE